MATNTVTAVSSDAVPSVLPRLGSNKPGIEYPSSEISPAFSKEWETSSPSGYTISEHLLGEAPISDTPFRILCIGAGASGIDFLHHAITKKSFDGLNVEVKCYEKNADVGGTWLENRSVNIEDSDLLTGTNAEDTDIPAAHATYQA
jgi:hypothetical protein